MGRHPKDDFSRRSKGIRLRLTPAEYAWIKTMAKENGINMREVLWQPFQHNLQTMAKEDGDKFGEMSAKVVQQMKTEEHIKKFARETIDKLFEGIEV